MIDYDETLDMAMKSIALSFAIPPELFDTSVSGLSSIDRQLQNEQHLNSLHNLSGLSVWEITEIVASLPYSLETVYRYCLAKGKFPNG